MNRRLATGLVLVALALVVAGVLWSRRRPETGPAEREAPAVSETPDVVPAPSPAEKPSLPPYPLEPDLETGIRGRFVDSSERPVAGVMVRLRIGREGRARVGEKSYATWESVARTTRADGRFLFADLDPKGRHWLDVEPPGDLLAKSLNVGRPARGEVKDLGDIALYRPATIEGQVTDPSGAPVAGVLVKIGEPMNRGWYRGTDDPVVTRADRVAQRVLYSIDREWPASGPLGPGVSRTDADGRFALVDLEPGTFVVSARQDGYRDARETGVEVREGETAGPVRLVLVAAYPLTVLVRDGDGRPVGESEITISENRGQDGRWSTRDWEGRTDEAGEVRFAVRVPEVHVSVLADRFRAEGRVVSLREEVETRVEFLLQPGGAMRGRVVDAETGEPIAREMRFRLHVSRTVHQRSGGVIGVGISVGEDGTFLDRGLAPGPYELWIMAPGYRELTLGPRVLEPGGTLDWGTIRLGRGFPVEVRVVDAAGRPVEGARVGPYYGPQGEVRTDADGRAELRILREGRMPLLAHHVGYAWARAEVDVAEGDEPPRVTITLVAGATVTGRVLGADGTPRGGLRVTIYEAQDGLPILPAPVDGDDDGRFCFERVPPGRYRLGAKDARSEAFTVADGETVEVDLLPRPPPSSGLEGRVVGADGTPVAGAKLTVGSLARGGDGGWSVNGPRLETDEEGRFTVRRVPPHVLVVTPTGRRVVLGLEGRLREITLRLPPEEADRPAATVTGTVREEGSGKTLGGAKVVLETRRGEEPVTVLRRFAVRAGADGRFTIRAPSGPYVLVASRAGSSTERRLVDLAAGDERTVDVALHPAGALLFRVSVRGELPRYAHLTLEVRREDEKEPGEPRYVSTSYTTEVLGLRLCARYEVTVKVDGEVRHRATHEAGTGEGPPIAIEIEATRR